MIILIHLLGTLGDSPRGARVVLVGASGCGKSQLLLTIAGFIHSSAGAIQLGPIQWLPPSTELAITGGSVKPWTLQYDSGSLIAGTYGNSNVFRATQLVAVETSS